MAKYNRIEVILRMKSTGIIPVFYHPDINVCKNILQVCYKGGIRAFEFTNRGDFAHEIFGELSKYSKKEFPELALGAGSIVDAPTTALYIQLGADFIVSPVLNPDMAKICNRRKVSWSPGCGSLSEISYAEELGAEIVKIFPALQVGGPTFVKAVKGPMPWTEIMPTGGVSPERENLEMWFESGVCCVGMGAKLFPKEWIRQKEYDKILSMVQKTMMIVNEIKNKFIK